MINPGVSSMKKYRNQVMRVFLTNIAVQLFVVIYAGSIEFSYDVKYVILYIWFVDLAAFLQLIMDKKISRTYTIIYFCEKLCSISFKITLIIYYNVNPIALYYVPLMQILLSITLLVNQVYSQYWAKKKHIVVYFNMIQIQQVIYIVTLVQVFILCLKWNQVIHYSYFQVLIPSWCLCSFSAFLVLILLICTLENCYNTSIRSKVQNSVLIWLTLYFIGMTAIPFIALVSISQWFDEVNKSNDLNAMTGVIISAIIYVVIFTLFTYSIRNKLIYFLRSQTDQQPSQTTLRVSVSDINITSSQRADPEKSKGQKWKRLKIPLLFLKISSSYFKIMGRKNSVSQSASSRQTVYQDCSNRPDSIQQSPCITIKHSNAPEQKSADNCLICFENEPDIILIPCQHGGICQVCADSIMQSTKQCYLCRMDIKLAVKVIQQDHVLEAVQVQKIIT